MLKPAQLTIHSRKAPMSKEKPTSAKSKKVEGNNFNSPQKLRKAHLHFTWIDHGFLRVFWTNLDQIAPGVWRANQPSPRRIAKFKAMGISTIINLRGANSRSPYFFEKNACEKEGVKLISFSLSARSMTKRENLLGLLDAFETTDDNFLMHCKSGADRAGLASALYLMHIKDVPVSIAKKQLSLRFLHLRFSKTGILDYMLEKFQTDTEKKTISIRHWIETVYDPDLIVQEFRSR